ncbi:MAG: helix-turn-helix transcriptional regulator [Pseudomonadota bacterium]
MSDLPSPDAVRLRQATGARFRHLRSDRAVVLRVRNGCKRVAGPCGSYVATEGQVALLPAHLPLDIENRPTANAPYAASALVLPMGLARPIGTSWAGTTALRQVTGAFERALDACADPGVPPAIRRHRATEVLLWLAEAGLALPADRPVRTADRCRALVGGALDRPWRAGDAARALAMSEPTLRRRLAAEGTGFADLLRELRMTQALTRLQTTDLPVSHVALEVGYASASRFARRFRARFGLPPSAIRTAPDGIGITPDRIGAETDRIGTAGVAADR